MSEVNINYKGSTIASMDASGTKTLQTSGKYCEDDVEVVYTRPTPPVPSYQTKSVTPSESAQTITADSGYDALEEVDVGAISSTYVGSGITRRSSTDLTASGATVTVPAGYYESQASKAVASGTAGTPTATKETVSNHSISVTPSVTNTSGYITGSTKTGTAVTVSASELVSGSETKTSNGTYDVTNLAEIVVDVSGGGSMNISTNCVVDTNNYRTLTVSNVQSAPSKFVLVYDNFGWNTAMNLYTYKVSSISYDGTTTNVYYVATANSSNAKVQKVDSGVTTWTYSSTQHTLTFSLSTTSIYEFNRSTASGGYTLYYS